MVQPRSQGNMAAPSFLRTISGLPKTIAEIALLAALSLSPRFVSGQQPAAPVKTQDAQPCQCSTQKVNGNCTITVDRRYPLTMPTIQMRSKATVTVVALDPLPFESLALNPQSAQAVAGTDQISGFFTAALPNLKGLVISTNLNTGKLGLSAQGLVPEVSEPADIRAVKANLQKLDAMLVQANAAISDFSRQALTINLQIQEILSPLPRPTLSDQTPFRASGVPPETPMPWTDYARWRSFLLCELDENECKG